MTDDALYVALIDPPCQALRDWNLSDNKPVYETSDGDKIESNYFMTGSTATLTAVYTDPDGQDGEGGATQVSHLVGLNITTFNQLNVLVNPLALRASFGEQANFGNSLFSWYFH